MRGKDISYKTVDDYIALQPQEMREKLERIRHTIRKAAPKAEEVISYGMPGYKLNGMLAFFALFKNHYSFFARPKTLDKFRPQLKAYKTSKGTVNFPLHLPVPVTLIRSIVKYGIEVNLADKTAREKKKTAAARAKKKA